MATPQARTAGSGRDKTPVVPAHREMGNRGEAGFEPRPVGPTESGTRPLHTSRKLNSAVHCEVQYTTELKFEPGSGWRVGPRRARSPAGSYGIPCRLRFSHRALRLIPKSCAARVWWPRV